jgi:hypothetical protein
VNPRRFVSAVAQPTALAALALGVTVGGVAVVTRERARASDGERQANRVERLEALSAHNDEAARQLASGTSARPPLDTAERELENLAAALRPTGTSDDVLSRLESLARDSGVRLDRLEESHTASGGELDLPVRPLVVSLGLRGRYGSLRRFLDRIAESGPAVRIDALEVVALTGDAAYSLRADLVVTYFISVPSEPGPMGSTTQ